MGKMHLSPAEAFDGRREPILLLKGEKIQYFNDSARRVLPMLQSGGLCPGVLLSLLEPCSCQLKIGHKRWAAASHRLENGLLMIQLQGGGQESESLPPRQMTMLSGHLRQQLSVISAAIHRLERLAEKLGEEEQEQIYKLLAEETKAYLRILRMVRSLELISLPVGQYPYDYSPSTLDLGGLCTTVERELRPLLRELDITLDSSVREYNLLMFGDSRLMMSLLYHLMSNAIRACGRGGTIVFRLERKKDRAIIRIEDSGPGVDAAQMAGLFDPTESPDIIMNPGAGLGLGIPICQRIAALHEGTLLLTNLPERGAQATISLPLSKDPGGVLLRSPSWMDVSGGYPQVLRELCDVLPVKCFRPEMI